MAIAFYEKVLGFSHQRMDIGEGDAYHILSRDGVGRTACLMYRATIPMRRSRAPRDMAVRPMDSPGVGRFGVLQDPTGAVLAVMKALPPSS
jgi:predicted enzyme related to lactoylglutathione lyase